MAQGICVQLSTLSEQQPLILAHHMVLLATNGDDLAQADFVILPGVGHFADCRANLAQAAGMEEPFTKWCMKKAGRF